MKKILFINHTGGIAGAETVFVDVIHTALTDKNNEVYVVCPADGNKQFEEKMSDLALKDFKYLPYRVLRNTPILALRNFSFSILSIIFLFFYCLYHRIDIIYSNTSVNVVGVIVARLLSKKHIWHIHELSTSNHRCTPLCLDETYRKLFLYKKNHSIFVSQAAKDAWEKQIGCQITHSEVLYSKYKKLVTTDCSDRIFTFGFLGSLISNKNIQTLINAFSNIQGGRLVIGGSGVMLDCLKLQASSSVRGNDIEFLGQITDLTHFYASIDVLVQVSINESWGLVALEAIGAGKLVIMTSETGLKEILDNEDGCIFVNPQNTHLIAKTMRMVMSDENFRERVILSGQKVLSKLDLNGIFDYQIKKILQDD